jgi:hypothetical protein
VAESSAIVSVSGVLKMNAKSLSMKGLPESEYILCHFTSQNLRTLLFCRKINKLEHLSVHVNYLADISTSWRLCFFHHSGRWNTTLLLSGGVRTSEWHTTTAVNGTLYPRICLLVLLATRLPHITLCDFFLKLDEGCCVCARLSTDIPDLEHRISLRSGISCQGHAGIGLGRNEISNCVCCVSCGAHIRYL